MNDGECFEERLLSVLRARGLDLAAGATVRWRDGEARVLSEDGRPLLRAVPRERGGYHVDVSPLLGGAEVAERAAGALARLGGVEREAWRRAAGPVIWSLPFDRGPGLYPLAEVDLQGVAARAIGEPDVRILYLEARCQADCVFCKRLETQSDGTAEALVLEGLRAGTVAIRDAAVLIGGPEPTEHALLAEFVAALRESGARRISMIATAERLADPGVAAELRRLGLEEVGLPIYGACAEVHDAIVRAPGAWERLMATIAAARGAGLRVYLHALVLRQNAHALGALGEWALAHALPLVVGLPRPKGSGVEFIPAAEMIRALPHGLNLVGLPRCLRDDPEPPEPAEPAALARCGPMLVYLAVQAGGFSVECERCRARSRCWGPPRGIAERWRGALRRC